VQQISRYYRAIREARPFAEKVDYGQPLRLMAIAPNFHRHNWIDHEHSTLAFEFCQFEIVGDRTVYPRFKPHPSAQELATFYTSTPVVACAVILQNAVDI